LPRDGITRKTKRSVATGKGIRAKKRIEDRSPGASVSSERTPAMIRDAMVLS
jgi:hypothetical protein